MKTRSLFIVSTILMVLLLACRPVVENNDLYKITQENIEAKTFENEPVLWVAEIDFNYSLLKSKSNDKFQIMLEDKKEKNIIREYSKIDDFVFKWIGKIENDPESQIIFVMVKDNTISGNIHLGTGEFYKIRYLEKGKHAIAKIDREKYPEDAPAVKVKGITMAMDPCSNTDQANDIDVMVLYTDDARAGSGNTNSMLGEIYLAVEETNQAYINSNITQRINLVHAAEVSYTETGSSSTDLSALQGISDGTLDTIHALRDNHTADVVALIVEDFESCGRAYVMETVSTNFEPYAFAVVERGCATGSYSFAHELGHIMGARHDCDNTSDLQPYAYAHGYYNTSPTPTGVANWRTIMSYNPTPSATRRNYFSNPGITYPAAATDGDPMGTNTGTCQADNHKTLNNTALSVANFRCTGSGIENVWMKDTWNDTGQEPDPNTASESMYRSPYIWVRNAQDVNLIHHHQHQNPVSGSGISNWIYVKLHNGGNALSGDLEVYYANASISLTWPGSWTLIDNPSLTVNANSTQIAEIEWTNLPGTGHYCLLARWNSSADPMHTAEGPNIGQNVRENNNIVWKNINIVPATSGDAPVSAKFHFGAIELPSFIRISCNDEYPNKAFARYANLSIEFDEKSQILLRNWKPNNPDIERKGNTLIIKDSKVDLKDLPFKPNHNGEIKITFNALKETPKMIYYVYVSHISIVKGKENEIGGVGYEVNTQLK